MANSVGQSGGNGAHRRVRRVSEGSRPIVPRTKDLFYSPAGHNLPVDDDAVHMFSSEHAHRVVIHHTIAKVSA